MDYQTLLRQLYQDFNARLIYAVLAHMHTDVSWPNGWEGGYVSGHEEVRGYWLRQWQQINPMVEPVSFEEKSDGRIAIKVRQIIKWIFLSKVRHDSSESTPVIPGQSTPLSWR